MERRLMTQPHPLLFKEVDLEVSLSAAELSEDT